MALRDLFVTADEGLRQAIVDAWGQSGAAEAGGLYELVRVAETERGSPAIGAGWVLLKFPAEPHAKEVGTRALLRGMSEGLSRDRILAVMDAPLVEGEVLDTLRKLAKSEDLPVKTAALVRLSENRMTREQAQLELWAMAKSGVRIAVFALARTGTKDVAYLLEPDLASQTPRSGFRRCGPWCRSANPCASRISWPTMMRTFA